MDAQTIAESLGGRRSGKGWIACCPAHDDKHPSLSITDADNGKILVFCHAGCRFEEISGALLDRGLWQEATSDQKHAARHRYRLSDIESAKTYVLIAESAIDWDEKLTKRERRKLFVSRKLLEAGYE